VSPVPGPVATVALIFWVFLWHVVSFLPLLTAFPPALFMFGLVWVFCAWVWPAATSPTYGEPR
jgi:hypothetical protein